jgi:polyferredoxin
MEKAQKSLVTIFLLMIPIIIFAEEGENLKKSFTLADLLFSAKYIVGFILAVLGIVLIWTKKLSITKRVPYLIVVFIVFAVYFGLHPSPICTFTKPFSYGMRLPFVAGMAFIGVLSIVSTKGFCGTICPAGALQEALYRIPAFKKLKRKKVPFKISNTVRIIFAALFLIGILGFGISVFSFVNLFEIFHWEYQMPAVNLIIFIVSSLLLLGLSLFLFRPFCYFVCPTGLITWVFEQIAPLKVRLKENTCTDCGVCEVKAPCQTVTDLVKGKKVLSDCHLCGDCMDMCPENAFYFGTKQK